MLSPVPPRLRAVLCAIAAAMALAGCATDDATGDPRPVPAVGSTEAPADAPAPSASPTSPSPVPPTADAAVPSAPPSSSAGPSPAPVAAPRPGWLGTRPLALRSDGFGEVVPTPPELVDRRLETPDVLPPPPGMTFRSSVRAVPEDVLARSTWSQDCPVSRAQLAYVQVSFWGFDARPHTGELLVAASVADDIVAVFRRLYEVRFPIEEMRVVRADELDLAPTGDGNNTTAFVCRAVRGQAGWSQHALGLAVDINPFHNPYVRDDLVIPELASAYTDRDDLRPGMIVAGDAVTAAFAAIGWGWGGDWTRPLDPMHFSSDGS